MGIRVLVIEDEAEIADFLVRGLREESFTVEHAADGDSAWHGRAVGGVGRGAARLVAPQAGWARVC